MFRPYGLQHTDATNPARVVRVFSLSTFRTLRAIASLRNLHSFQATE